MLADGIEKDIALVVAPSITLPCAPADASDAATASLPPLSNVAAITPGPFTVTIPIAARYDELTRAMSMAFTDGKLFFSPEYPGLYLEKPEIYESQGQLVLKLHIAGPVHELGHRHGPRRRPLPRGAPDGHRQRAGRARPRADHRDAQLSPLAQGDDATATVIREQARQALRLDIGERLRDARDKLGDGTHLRARQGLLSGRRRPRSRSPGCTRTPRTCASTWR